MKKFALIITALILSVLSFSQISAPLIELYGGGSAGSGETKPFWNISNQHGKYSTASFEGIIGLKLESIDSSASFLSVDYGLELYNRFGIENTYVIHQGYAEIKSPYLVLRAGRKEEVIGNQDTLLSQGAATWSSNHTPIPELVLATPGYIDVPFTKGYVEVNGSLSHGWFEKDRYVENVYLHQKHLHMRVGGDFFINASVGLIHFAQWGGNSPDPRFGELPSDFDSYKRVFFAQPGDSTKVGPSEYLNKLGNHLGSRTYRIDLKPERFRISLYYQTLFEDGSGLAHEFYRDGLSGISFKIKESQKLVNHLVLEFLHTTYQSGPVHILNDSIRLIGNDNYFNNGLYRNGWTYYNMTIGTPLITSPAFNEDGNETILNNRVLGFHMGIAGMLGAFEYHSFFTYSVNKGTYGSPIDPSKNQFSWYLETTFPAIWKGVDLNVMLAADIGDMYGNNLGVNLVVRKRVDLNANFRP